ncbi:unnamed protein product, partial [Iphiclides podalirius]
MEVATTHIEKKSITAFRRLQVLLQTNSVFRVVVIITKENFKHMYATPRGGVFPDTFTDSLQSRPIRQHVVYKGAIKGGRHASFSAANRDAFSRRGRSARGPGSVRRGGGCGACSASTREVSMLAPPPIIQLYKSRAPGSRSIAASIARGQRMRRVSECIA